MSETETWLFELFELNNSFVHSDARTPKQNLTFLNFRFYLFYLKITFF